MSPNNRIELVAKEANAIDDEIAMINLSKLHKSSSGICAVDVIVKSGNVMVKSFSIIYAQAHVVWTFPAQIMILKYCTVELSLFSHVAFSS